MLGMRKQVVAKSLVGAGMRIQGNCHFHEGLQIDGEVMGDVTAEPGAPGVLVISESGSVQGSVSADRVVISGRVIGPVLAREMLELQPTARVQGDVQYKMLEMQQGAVIAGQLQPKVMPLPLLTGDPATLTEPRLEHDPS